MLTLYHNTVNKSTVKAGPISKKKQDLCRIRPQNCCLPFRAFLWLKIFDIGFIA